MRHIAKLDAAGLGVGIMGGGKPPIPLTIDFSLLADGALPATLTGATWAIVTGKAYNTPTESANLLTDSGMETWTSATDLTNWTETIQSAGTTTINQDGSVKHAGSYSARIDVDAAGKFGDISQSRPASIGVGDWVNSYAYFAANGTGKVMTIIHNNQLNSGIAYPPPNGSFAQFVLSSVCKQTSGYTIQARSAGSASSSLWVDDFEAKELTLITLFAYMNAKQSNVTTKGAWTITQGTLAGVVMNLDSVSNPQNFVVLLSNGDRNNLYLWKVVAGTPSQVASVAITYSAGKNIELRKTAATTYQMFYNGVQVGTDQTISDVGIISNTLHGVFSTYGGNSLDRFFVG